MAMKKTLIYTVVLIAMSVTSCDDLLVEEPRSFVAPDQFFNTVEECEGALFGVKSFMANYEIAEKWYLLRSELGTDVALMRELPHWTMQNYELEVEYSYLVDIWRAHYTAIGNANMQDAEKINVITRGNLLIDLESKSAQTIVTAFEKRGLNYKTFKLLVQKPDELENKNYDSIILILPGFNAEPGYIDQEIYEKLFLLFQELDLNSEQILMAISSETYFGLDKDSYPLSGGVSGFIKTL